LKDTPWKICAIAAYILVVVSIPLLSTTTTSNLSNLKTGIHPTVLPAANAFSLGSEDDIMDFPYGADAVPGDIFNNKETKENLEKFFSQSSLLPHLESEELGTDNPPPQVDLKEDSAQIVREHGDEIPNQHIVVVKNEPTKITSEAALDARRSGAKVLNVFEHVLNGFSIKVPNEKVLAAIQKNPHVAYIEQDMEVQAFAQVLPRGVNRVDGELSSTISGNGAGSVNVDIAILDTGIQLSHPDLNVYRQRSLVSYTSSANDDNGHGTHVAGIAAAKDNSIGTVGVAPGARLWAVKVLGSSGSGSISTIIKGIDYVTQNAAYVDIANLSLGCQCSSASLNTAISNSAKAGITYVVAAGNNGQNAAYFSPANHPSVIAVSAIG
jgi:subtilisin family serine protease